MCAKTLVVLIAVAVMGASSTAMARGGGKGGSAHFGHGHFNHRFHNNLPLFNSWGWGWGGWGPYGEGGYTNTTVAIFPQATPKAVELTGATNAGPCHWNENTFSVPSLAGGTRPVSVVSCH